MCTNEECVSDELSINELGLSVTGLLEHYELSRFEHRFGEHSEISERIQDRLIEAIFPLRNLCWECARPSIEMAMNWRFDFLHWGIPLHLHRELSNAISSLGELCTEWTELLLFFYAGPSDPWTKTPIKWASLDELVALISESILAGLTPNGLSEIQSWFNSEYTESITSDQLRLIVSCGFRNEVDLELLHSSEIDLNEYFWTTFPSRQVLELFEDGLVGYEKYRMLLDRNLANDDGDTESDQAHIVKLLETGVPIEQLIEVSHEILEDEQMEIVFEDLEEDLTNINGVDIIGQFIKSVRAIKTVHLEMSKENLVQFWGLSAAMILHLIDNDLEEEDHYRLARLVDDVSGFDGWLREMDQFDELHEVGEWAKFGFKPNEAVSWKSTGFEPNSASKWREIVDNPEVARRRSDAGIRLVID